MLKNKLLIYANYFLVFLLTIIPVSCSDQNGNVSLSTEPELANQSWIPDEECSIPCWQGLEIGTATRNEANRVVQNLSFVQKQNQKVEANWENYYCIKPTEITCVAMEFDNETLNQVHLYVNYQLTLEEVIEKIGVPNSFYFIQMPESFDCDISLFWINRQLVAEINYDGRQNICEELSTTNGFFPRGLLVTIFAYSSQREIDAQIASAQEPDTGWIYSTWKGFAE